jgi:hypothetical protein
MKLGIHKQALKELEEAGLSHCIQSHAGIQKLLKEEEILEKIPTKAALPPFEIPRNIKLSFLVKIVTNSQEGN